MVCAPVRSIIISLKLGLNRLLPSEFAGVSELGFNVPSATWAYEDGPWFTVSSGRPKKPGRV